LFNRALLFVPLLSFLGLISEANGRTWQIRVDQSGDAPTIQAGIDGATTGDSVLVAPGTYFEDIDFLGKDIVLKSLLGPEVTILDGTGQDSSVVIFQSGETRARGRKPGKR
jgi:hypothetical protein